MNIETFGNCTNRRKVRGIDGGKFDSKEREALKAFQEALEKREKEFQMTSKDSNKANWRNSQTVASFGRSSGAININNTFS